jgi:hypothetical protein
MSNNSLKVTISLFVLTTFGFFYNIGAQSIPTIPSTNLVVNGNFSKAGKMGLPADWHVVTVGNADVDVSRIEVGSGYILQIRVINPGNSSQVYIVGRTKDMSQGEGSGSAYWKVGNKIRVSAKAKITGGQGTMRALWGTFSLDDVHRTEPRSPHNWIELERVSTLLDYRNYPRFCALVCYPATKGEVFQFTDFILEKVDDSTKVQQPLLETNWPEITAEKAKMVSTRAGNIIYDSGFNSYSDSKWWPVRTKIKEGIGINGSRGADGFCYSDYLLLDPGKPYTLSAYIKADKPTKIQMMVLHARIPGSIVPVRDDFGVKSVGFRKIFDVNSKWQRYHASFIPGFVHEQLDLDSYFVLIKEVAINEKNTVNPNNVVIDNVQFEEGHLRPYMPRPLEGYVTVSRNQLTGVSTFYPGETFRVSCRLVANSKSPKWADIVVVDYYGREVMRHRKRLAFTLGREENWIEMFNLKEPGVYRVYLDAPGLHPSKEDRHLSPSRSSALAIIDRKWEGSNEIACAQYIVPGPYTKKSIYSLARILGVHNARIVVKWKELEPQRGTFDYEKLDIKIAETLNGGLKPWITVDNLHIHNGTQSQNTGFPAWLNINENVSLDGVSLEVLEAWSKYILGIATRYKDQVTHFECLNEPSIDLHPKVYMDFLRTMHKEVKKTKSSLKVMGPSTFLDEELSLKYTKYLLNLSKLGLAEYIDVFSFHHYEIPDADEPGQYSMLNAQERYEKLKALIPQISQKNMPLWSNEYALRSAEWYTLTDRRVPPTNTFKRGYPAWAWETDFNEAVNYTVKDVVIGYYNSVRLFSPHILLAGGWEDQKSVWPQHGIGYSSYLKPDVVAFAATCARFAPDTAPATWFKVGNTGSVYVFQTTKGAMASLFTVSHAGMEFTWDNIPDKLLIENVYGSNYPWLKRKGSSLTLVVGAEPVFFTQTGGTPEELANWLKKAINKKVPVHNNRDFFGDLIPPIGHFPTWTKN